MAHRHLKRYVWDETNATILTQRQQEILLHFILMCQERNKLSFNKYTIKHYSELFLKLLIAHVQRIDGVTMRLSYV